MFGTFRHHISPWKFRLSIKIGHRVLLPISRLHVEYESVRIPLQIGPTWLVNSSQFSVRQGVCWQCLLNRKIECLHSKYSLELLVCALCESQDLNTKHTLYLSGFFLCLTWIGVKIFLVLASHFFIANIGVPSGHTAQLVNNRFFSFLTKSCVWLRTVCLLWPT